VSISRRGLLAAGLTAAVVGSIGVASMINANADDTASATSDTAQVVDDGAVAAPPARLPWGQAPERLRRGWGGASSAQVASAGDDIAPKDSSDSLVPRPEWAPKGRYSRGSGLRQEQTSVQPPLPPPTGVLRDTTSTDNTVDYFYAVGSQTADSDGAYANIVVAKPNLDKGDFHTLAEISVQSADGSNTVEVGWNVDRTVNGDEDPHLFVFHWVNGVQSCYNACGFTQYSKTTTPGDTLPLNVTRQFGIQHFGGNWWVAYDSEWIGYYPDSLWNGAYTRAGVQQFFGEVAASNTTPCTAMGNGVDANSTSAARFGSVALLNASAVASVAVRTLGPDKETASPYPLVALSTRTFRFGGPGNGTC